MRGWCNRVKPASAIPLGDAMKSRLGSHGARRLHLLVASVISFGFVVGAVTAFGGESNDVPRYKPASRSPEPIDITTNAYGASRDAPNALAIGARAPDFVLARAGGGEISLEAMRRRGPVALIFYRGHW